MKSWFELRLIIDFSVLNKSNKVVKMNDLIKLKKPSMFG